jgi:RNA polymerase sigma-70 factor (ECF subfamily)
MLQSMDQKLDQWFTSEVLPHEAALMRYLGRVCKAGTDIADLRQEAYVRVYESARQNRPRSPKSFLFATARNLLVDRLRRERIVPIDYSQDLESLAVLVDELSPERRLSARQELQSLAEAFDLLPHMTRAVIWNRRIVGLSQREAAQALGIAEGALEAHMIRGLRSLANALISRAALTPGGAEDVSENHRADHG